MYFYRGKVTEFTQLLNISLNYLNGLIILQREIKNEIKAQGNHKGNRKNQEK